MNAVFGEPPWYRRTTSGQSDLIRGPQLAWFAIATLLLLAACGDGTDADSYFRQPAEPGASLRDRATLPAAVESYEALLRELQAAVAWKVGFDGWSRRDPTSPTALCQDFGVDADTGIRTLPFVLYDRFIPGREWEDVVEIVSRITRRHGFGPASRIVDRPDEHRLDLTDRYGAELSLQDGPKLLSIGLITGCHLRTDDRAH